MEPNNIICPVCTLYLRPGITLKSHLASHSKQKVIDALVKLSGNEDLLKDENVPPSTEIQPAGTSNVNSPVANPSWNSQGSSSSSNISPVQGNHLFIYQQSMSTTAPQSNVLNINPLSPQYVIPTVFNPQMMPYVYQQQQVIMSSNACVPPPMRAIPYDVENPQETGDPPISELAEDCIEDVNEKARVQDIENVKQIEPVPSTSCATDVPDVQKEELLANEELHIIETVKDCGDMIEDELEDDYESDHPEYVDEGNDHDECVGSPHSASDTNWSLRLRTDLNKACQTQNPNNTPPCTDDVHVEGEDILTAENQHQEDEDQPKYYYVNQQSEDIPYTTININSNSLSEPIYTSSNVLQSNDHIDFVEMEGMHVIIGDFSSNPIISQVENFDNSRPERPGVLMTIGDIVDTPKPDYSEQRDMVGEESMSRESSNVNIRADERMPPRGELSGQESMGGASDITWNRIQYHEGSSGLSASYDLLARESWEASDSSDVEIPPLQSRIPLHVGYPPSECNDDTPTIVSYSGPPLNFKCSTCGEAFANSKERKEHEIESHPEKIIKKALLGGTVGKKKVKKITVKLKPDKPKSENNFDNVFTNKLKLETTEGEQPEIVPAPETLIQNIKIDDTVPVELKTVCPICDCVLPNAKALKLHKFEVHKVTAEIRHKCTTCGEAFPNEYKYTQHLKVHPLECRLCGKLFYRRQNIQLHMKRHLGLKPYKCELCHKSFVTKQKHDEHRNTHTGDAPIKCSLCDETFRRHSNLVQHRNRHHFNLKKKVKDYICFCGEVFHSKKKLAWHREIHDPKPKACTQCSEKFVHMSSLTRHMRRAHNEKFLPNIKRSSENVECPICKGVYLRSSLEVHIRTHTGKRPYTCLICNKDFTTKWNLKLHKWTHASRTTKPFKCDQCKGAFIRESDYVAHMNSHKSVRPYTCNYCGAQFIRKYNCQRHVREHENGKTFNCQVCGKSFHRSYYLKDHMRIHSGVRPYSCHICGKTSTTKSNHNKHVQIHHAREPVSTEN